MLSFFWLTTRCMYSDMRLLLTSMSLMPALLNTMNDLFTLTNYVGYDVVGNATSAAAGGTGGEGIDFWSLPSPRTYTLGFSLTF